MLDWKIIIMRNSRGMKRRRQAFSPSSCVSKQMRVVLMALLESTNLFT